MSKDLRFYLARILGCIEKIKRFTAGRGNAFSLTVVYASRAVFSGPIPFRGSSTAIGVGLIEKRGCGGAIKPIPFRGGRLATAGRIFAERSEGWSGLKDPASPCKTLALSAVVSPRIPRALPATPWRGVGVSRAR